MADDLIHEIEESIKQDKLEQFWKEYGSYIIAAAILIVLLTALITGWRNWNHKVNASQTTALLEAWEADNKVSALESIMEGLRPGHLAVARLSAAGLLLEQGQNEGALRHYRQAAQNEDIEPAFRQLARLMAVRLEWDLNGTEATARPLLDQLQTIWNDAESPWRFHARMQAATILAHGLGNYSGARDHLAVITTADKVPGSLLERARALNHVYGIKMQTLQTNEDRPAPEEAEG